MIHFMETNYTLDNVLALEVTASTIALVTESGVKTVLATRTTETKELATMLLRARLMMAYASFTQECLAIDPKTPPPSVPDDKLERLVTAWEDLDTDRPLGEYIHSIII